VRDWQECAALRGVSGAAVLGVGGGVLDGKQMDKSERACAAACTAMGP
jgi:hypothetical protein